MQTPVILGTPANLGTNTQNSNVSLGTVSVEANKPIVVAVLQATYGGAPNAITPDPANTLGLTWSVRANNTPHSDITSAAFYVATGVRTSGSASGELFVGVGNTSSVARTQAFAVDMGADGAASPAAIVQVSDILQEPSEGSSDATIPGLEALAPGSGVIAIFAAPGVSTPVFTAENGFTQLAPISAADGVLSVIYKLEGTPDPRVTTDDDFVRVNGIAFEIKADGGGGPTGQAARTNLNRQQRNR